MEIVANILTSDSWKISEMDEWKYYTSSNGSVNYRFNKETGYTEIWGKNKVEDPISSPEGPMIIDFEITEKCYGVGTKHGTLGKFSNIENNVCSFCYKSNLPNKGKITTFEEAKEIIDRIPKLVTQIAFGTDATLSTNSEWYEIFQYARKQGYIPNVTVADLNKETAEKVADVCGAVSVSRYNNKEICYQTIENLSKCKQINIHILLSQETLPLVYETLMDIELDKRLQNLNSIVFLSLKQKGRGVTYNSINQEQFTQLVQYCLNHKIRFGFDSCSANKFLKSLSEEQYNKYSIYTEPCESSLFSMYINAYGQAFPCSFIEGIQGWKYGLEITSDFINDVWNNEKMVEFRKNLIKNKRNCPLYQI